MGAKFKKTITLSDKKSLTVDVTDLLESELRDFYDPVTPDEKSNEVIARLCSVKDEYVAEMLRNDFRHVFKTIEELAFFTGDGSYAPKLSDGKTIEIDVSSLKQREYNDIFNARVVGQASDEVLARLSSEKLEYIKGLTHIDFRKVLDRVVYLANRPLDDPNSQSGSTSP